MPSTREIRYRIKSVGNISKITNAMQLVAASKMRRAQQRVLESRAYAEQLAALLPSVAGAVEGLDQLNLPLLESRAVRNPLFLLITPDRGLAGSLVSNTTRAAEGAFKQHEGRPLRVTTIGRKGERFVAINRIDLAASFNSSENPTEEDVRPIARYLSEQFATRQADAVTLVYPRFINTAVQKPVVQQLLPINADAMEGGNAGRSPIFDQPPAELLRNLIEHYVQVELFQALLEANASEHSARMVAMKNATDNATELTEELTLEYNKVRQEAITNELLDIVGGSSAMN